MSVLKIKDWKYRLNPKLQNTWDVIGYKNNPNFWGTQSDWNQTLATKINEISAHMHMATLLGGADTIETHPINMAFIECFEYYNNNTKKIGQRFDVVINDTLDKNRILVYRNEVDLCIHKTNILTQDIRKKSTGMVVIKNRI